MKLRILLPFLMALGLCPIGFAQEKTGAVLADGDPPLTDQMASDYMRFIQWSLRTPLTLAQQGRIRSFLVDSWKAANSAEISRTLNILTLRGQIDAMGLKDSRWAAFQTGADALRNWRSSESMDMARWGLSIYNASHVPLIKGTPALTRHQEDAYEELGYFMLSEVDGRPPVKIDAVERTQFADAMSKAFPQLTPEQKGNLAELPKVWVQFRTAWPTLDDSTKASFRTMWKTGFNPVPKAATPPAKGAKPTPPAKSQPAINYLVKMTWVINPDIFAKMKAVGTPYGLGW